MASIKEVNAACDRAYEANSGNLTALYEGYIDKTNRIGALLFEAAGLVRNVPYEQVREGFEQTAYDLHTTLDGTQDNHSLGAMGASKQAAVQMEELPPLCQAIDDRLKDALDAVKALQGAVTAVQTNGFATAHHLEKRPK